LSRRRDALARPSIVRWAVVVAALLSSPSLLHGFEVDDRLQRQGALGGGTFGSLGRSPFDLYNFVDGNPEHTRVLIDHGFGAWWSDLHARVAFLRPITSILLWCDHHVLKHAVLLHVHSILWYLVAVALAGLLYRQFIGKAWVAGLAAMLFAVDHTHGLLASWIAQRNSLIAGVFGFGALFLHDRARKRGGGNRDVVLASVCLGLSLFSAEASLGIVPYLVAHAWFLDRKNVRALLPYVPPLALWAIVYKLGDYGARGSGLYVDPGKHPLQFLGSIPTHGPILVATELGMPATDFYPFVPIWAKAIIVGVSVAMVIAFFVAIGPLFRRDATTRFFVTGAVLSLLPSCAVFPSGRLLFFASLGMIGALAQLIAAWREGEGWFPTRGVRRAITMPVVYWSALGHLFFSPFAFLIAMNQMTILEGIVIRNANGLPDAPELARQRVVIVNAPDATFLAYISIIREAQGRPAPAKVLGMAAGVRPLELARIDDKTVTLSSSVALVQPGTDLLIRSTDPFEVGYRVALSDVTIEITRVNADGWPTEARFTFARPLEDPSLRFMQWKDQTLAPLALPKIGERIAFPAQFVKVL